MSKILFFSIKSLIVLFSAWLVTPVAEMIDQITPQPPPMIIYWILFGLMLTHEPSLAIRPVRQQMILGFSKNGVFNLKQALAVWFSLMCIRLFCLGKLNEIWYPEYSYNSETYFQLIGLICTILGITAISNFWESKKKTTSES